VKKTHDYVHHYRGYWSDGGRCHSKFATKMAVSR